jgi:hypothetical protein
MVTTDAIGALLPQPQELRIEGAAHPAARLTSAATVGVGAASVAWSLLEDLRPGALPAEGYALRITTDGGPARVVLAAVDAAGLARGRETLRQLERAESITPLSIRDWPQLPIRGVIEGFYGGPWSHPERLDCVQFEAAVGFNTFLYAPKDEPYHRDRWRELYPDEALTDLRELAQAAATCNVQLVYALAPGLSMRFSADSEHEALAAKAEQLWQAGIRSFALLFDDVPTELRDDQDVERFGADAEATGVAHGLACAEFAGRFLAPHGISDPVLMCPTDYAGCAASPYRTGLARTLPADALVLWTGPDIVVGEISRADIDRAAASYGRDLVLWDNFPVNDFDRTRLFLGPLQGRTTELEGSALRGIVANPMVEAYASQFALASVADWAWNTAAYSATDAAGRALLKVAGANSEVLAPLVAVCSSWPPSASQSVTVEAMITGALAGEAGALDSLESTLGALAGSWAVASGGSEGSMLVADLRPWISAAADVGRAGVLACRLLRRLDAPGSHGFGLAREGLRTAQAEAESHYSNVLRTLMPGFVDAVLERAGLEGTHARHRHVTVLIGANPTPGDRGLSERLGARGFSVTLSSRIETREALEAVDLVIVTRGASVEAARAAVASAVPVLAWAHLAALGLAAESAVTLSRDSIRITDPDSPLAADLSGRIRVYRGTGKITWGEPSSDAHVIARAVDDEHPVIVSYRKGAELPDGTAAAAPRVTSFLGSQGLAPWLMSDDGRLLLDAAVDHLVRSP